ncbi:14939_t:CDS:2 [Funneliformis mosseae]|uniref:14939_t:CDS:1 n=1 Tax=Funneliformis mosseae TaxID=27381 RepID=A0A9N8VJ62_FUNMO|nr:14939_t:CDS:2 [Funneliformis mosseae]
MTTDTKKFWVYIKNTPRVTSVKVSLNETAETIIEQAKPKYGPEISQYSLIELTLVDSTGKIIDPTIDIKDITNENSRDNPFEIRIINNEGNFLEHKGDGIYYPTAATFRSQYDVDEFLGTNHLQSVDPEGRPTGTQRTRKYKDLKPESYYVVHKSDDLFLKVVKEANYAVAPSRMHRIFLKHYFEKNLVITKPTLNKDQSGDLGISGVDVLRSNVTLEIYFLSWHTGSKLDKEDFYYFINDTIVKFLPHNLVVANKRSLSHFKTIFQSNNSQCVIKWFSRINQMTLAVKERLSNDE